MKTVPNVCAGAMRASTLAATVAVSLVAMAASLPAAAGKPRLTPVPAPVLTSNELLGEAAANECFAGIGVDYPPMNPDGTCPTGVPKTNESYIWGLTEQSGKLWFGTMANTACVLSGQLDPTLARLAPSDLFVCEYGQSQIARTHPAIPASMGDWRPPRIYSYDLATETLTRRQISDPLINKTLGFRGAGSIDNIAFLAGQSLAGDTINIFAFEADTGRYLGSCSTGNYNYIRQWKAVDGVLYVGAGSLTRGAVLRWDGSAASFPGNFCSAFTEVGRMSADAANVALYTGGDGQDRLAVTTVPIRTGGGGTGAGVGVWISPPLGPDGLTPGDADSWRRVWSPQQYDPDKIVSQFGYSGGATHYFDGWLYWGTIHLQNSAALRIHQTCPQSFCYGKPANAQEAKALKDGVYRTASVWRGRNLENPATREIQLLYGETELPAVTAPKTFEMMPTGWTPLYGPSGFGNRANEYIWQMAVFDNRLFIGTYDASVLQGELLESGGDLWRFDSSVSPAVNEDFSGLGDILNYGIRAMSPLEDHSGLIVGMANPFNLATGGGWELRRLKEGAP
jgi:hypothetical protein